MIDKTKLKERLATLLRRSEFTSLATFAKEPLIEAFVAAAEECEVIKETSTLIGANAPGKAVEAKED